MVFDIDNLYIPLYAKTFCDKPSLFNTAGRKQDEGILNKKNI